jgi:hypothetical protein
MKRSIPFALLLFVILGCSQTKQPATQPETPLPVDAAMLTKAYSDNEVAADGQYKGKMLAVSGIITGITETFGSVQVDLEGHKENGVNLVSVKCTFEETEKASVAGLKKGSKSTLTGRNEGMTAGLFVGLDKCKVG